MDALRDHPQVLYGAVAALVIVILLTPAVGGMARLLGVVDRPEARRLNPNPVPRLGGIAIFFGIFVPALAFLELGRETRGVLLGAAVATVVGAIDDFRVLSPGWKLAGQILSASIPPFFGVWISTFTFPFLDPTELPAVLGVPLTMLWIVAVMNMVNFLDGMDGRPPPAAARAGGSDPRHVLRRRPAAEARPADQLGRSSAPALPLPQARLLAAAGRGDDVGLVRDARRRGPRDAVHPVPQGRRLASLGDAGGDRDRARGARVLALRRLRARDREVGEPAALPSGPPARAARGAPLRLAGFCARDEVGERLVEAGGTLDGVAGAGKDDALRREIA